jgi:hypothetical protein
MQNSFAGPAHNFHDCVVHEVDVTAANSIVAARLVRFVKKFPDNLPGRQLVTKFQFRQDSAETF